MKPMGPLPAGFGVAANELAIGGRAASVLVGEAGGTTPLFVYDGALVAARVAALRDAMPAGLGIHYAMKANPLPVLVRMMAQMVDGVDVASAGELTVARAADARHISFAGPGKRDAELAVAIDADVVINLESENELTRALAIAGRIGRAPRLAVRVNPDFDLKASGMRMGGGAAAFGVDAERVPALVRRIVAADASFAGFHIFAGSQNLRADLIAEAQGQTVALAARLADAAGVSPPLVNLGGGFGIPYFPGDEELDIAHIGAVLADTLAARPAVLADSRFAIELGRWLVGPAGVYLTRVVDVKDSRGRTFVVTDGGLHHQLAASGNFGTVIRRNYPLVNASRFGDPAEMVADVVGCLCTPLDRLGEQVAIAAARPGDLIALFMAGAYGATASPAAFLGHPPAGQLLLPPSGDVASAS